MVRCEPAKVVLRWRGVRRCRDRTAGGTVVSAMHGDAVVACADLVGRAGASGFEIGYLHDDVPVEEAGWYASASYKGARLMADEHRSPTAAAMALAERILGGAACRCGKPVALNDEQPGCRWTLMGKRWEPGCDAPPLRVKGERGDHAAMVRALEESGNRADRRAAKRRRS
jgi:hypothetical protein